jgi:glycosylphosphatidylinositol transamidase (GPIT) subunit GPI8
MYFILNNKKRHYYNRIKIINNVYIFYRQLKRLFVKFLCFTPHIDCIVIYFDETIYNNSHLDPKL